APRDFLCRNKVSLARTRTCLAGFLPVLGRAHVAFPERPGPALARTHGVDRAAGLAIVKNAIPVGFFAKAAAAAHPARVKLLELFARLSTKHDEGVELLFVDPDKTRRPGATVSTLGAA